MLLRSFLVLLAFASFGRCVFEGEEPVFDGYATDGYAGLRDGYGDAYGDSQFSDAPIPAKELQSLDDIDAFVQVEFSQTDSVHYFLICVFNHRQRILNLQLLDTSIRNQILTISKLLKRFKVMFFLHRHTSHYFSHAAGISRRAYLSICIYYRQRVVRAEEL